MSKNSSLNRASQAKQDEFYTRFEDIQNELNHYEKHFKDKTVLCNCDDPFESNFCKFFLRNFNYLGLKRLICTSYHSSSIAGSQISFFELIEDKIEQYEKEKDDYTIPSIRIKHKDVDAPVEAENNFQNNNE